MTVFFIFLVICLGVAYVADMYWPFLLSGASFILTGMLIFCNQLFTYLDLQKARWEPFSFLKGLKIIFSQETYIGSWATTPKSLKGLHGFMESTPLTIALILMGTFFITFYLRKSHL